MQFFERKEKKTEKYRLTRIFETPALKMMPMSARFFYV